MLREQFTQPLLSWFDKYGRKNLPWQMPRSPYFVWLSEIMLQQTQVKTVIPYFNRFIERFPSLQTLASASVDEVLTIWSGLGYYSRARNLHRCAINIMEQHQGNFPSSVQTLITLPGIGESTGAAIASLAFNQPAAILDGNVKRVLCRFFAIDEPPNKARTKNKLWQLAQLCMDDHRCADYTQAIMDLGATCCTRVNPNCDNCPLKPHCQAYTSNIVDLLPIRTAKKEKPNRESHFILLHNDKNEIFLQKNEDQGIWGGLWCLPNFPSMKNIQHWLEKNWAVKQEMTKPTTTLKHSFTHFHLQLNVYEHLIDHRIKLIKNNERWLTSEEITQVGLPKPISVLLKRFWQE